MLSLQTASACGPPSEQTFTAGVDFVSSRNYSQYADASIESDKSDSDVVRAANKNSSADELLQDTLADGLHDTVIATGGQELPLTGGRAKFLETKDILLEMAACESPLRNIPMGKKESHFYVVDNNRNHQRRKEGMKSEFVEDDCGAWSKTPSPTTYYLA